MRRPQWATLAAATALLIASAIATSLEAPRSAGAATTESDEELARRALSETERTWGTSSTETATALIELARMLDPHAASRVREGIEITSRALAIRESRLGPEAAEVAEALESLGWWYWNAREYERERPLVERALSIRERQVPPDPERTAVDLHLLSDLDRIEGDYGRALERRERAGRLFELAGAHAAPHMPVHYYSLALIQAAIGDRQSAIASAAKAVDLREREGSSREELARSLNLLGWLRIQAGDLDPGEALLERALALWQVGGEGNRTATAYPLTNLARSSVRRRDWDRAAGLFSRALEIRLAALGPDDALVARTCAELGAVERRRGRRDAARDLLRRALAIQATSDRSSYPEWAVTLRELALLDADEGRLEAALVGALQAEGITREHFRASALGLSEREALARGRERRGGLDFAWAWAARQEREGALTEETASRLLDEAIRSRTLVLDTLSSRQRVLALHPDAETAMRVAALARDEGRLAHLVMDTPGLPPAQPERLARLSAEIDRAQRSLAERSREYREERERARPGLAEVRRALPPRTALVSYFRYRGVDAGEPAGYVACVLQPAFDAPSLVPLGVATPIDDAVAAWRDEVSRDPRIRGASESAVAYRRAARRLAATIWDPVASRLSNVDRVIVVADGALQQVSLATLVDRDDRYLVETDLSFHYLTAERDLVVASGRHADEASVLVVGDPAYGVPGDSATRRFDPLPGTRAEALAVAASWPARARAELLVGKDATEQALKRMAPSFSVLHVATHGVFQAFLGSGDSPLRIAGLAMAGANRPTETDDGILTAEEIALLDLRGVDWAVLSACATGDGALEPGEGVLGLRRAFQIAGARALIVSLWPVEDDATRYWMRRLYASRRAGASTVDAVRDATAGALEEQRRLGLTMHPYFWGGFISIGDWR